ncbi:MAG: hypothetical protein ACI8ZM_003867 [Crocinitomix sp.]|jgi:hypothetical protein
MSVKYALLFLLLSFAIPEKARCANIQKIDQIIDSLSNLDDRSGDLILILNELDSMSRSIGYNPGIIYANIELCYAYRIIDPNKVYDHVGITDKLLEQDPEAFTLSNLVKHYLIKGYNLGDRGNSFQELKMYLKADSLALEDTTGRLRQGVNFLLSSYYISEKEYEKALAVNASLIAYYKDRDDKMGKHSYVMSIHNAGSIHLEMKNYDSTVYYMLNALDNGIGDYASGPWLSYLNLSQSYIELGELGKADYYLKLFEKNPQPLFSRNWVQYHLLYGNFEYKRNAFNEASLHFEKALMKADSIDWLKALETANFSILKSELSSQNQPHLVRYLKNFDSIKNIFSNKNTEKYEKQLLIQFETSEKEAQIARLSEENVNRKYLTTRIIAISIFIVLILLVIVYSFKTKKSRLFNQLERERLTKKIAESALEKSLENVQAKAKLIEELKADVQSYSASTVNELSEILSKNYISESDWASVILHFDGLYDNFTQKIKLKYPTLKTTDIRLLVLVNLGYSNKGIASVNNISEDGAKKAKRRLRQKMEVENLPLLGKS